MKDLLHFLMQDFPPVIASPFLRALIIHIILFLALTVCCCHVSATLTPQNTPQREIGLWPGLLSWPPLNDLMGEPVNGFRYNCLVQRLNIPFRLSFEGR